MNIAVGDMLPGDTYSRSSRTQKTLDAMVFIGFGERSLTDPKCAEVMFLEFNSEGPEIWSLKDVPLTTQISHVALIARYDQP